MHTNLENCFTVHLLYNQKLWTCWLSLHLEGAQLCRVDLFLIFFFSLCCIPTPTVLVEGLVFSFWNVPYPALFSPLHSSPSSVYLQLWHQSECSNYKSDGVSSLFKPLHGFPLPSRYKPRSLMRHTVLCDLAFAILFSVPFCVSQLAVAVTKYLKKST